MHLGDRDICVQIPVLPPENSVYLGRGLVNKYHDITLPGFGKS